MRSFWSNKRAKYILMGIHALCTLIWARLVFINVGINPSGTVALNSKVSDSAELVITYILTEAIALFFIFLLWNLIFKVFGNFRKKYIPFLIIYSVGTVCILLAWPEVLIGILGMDDNLVTFAAGVRLTPDYWHSAYSSMIYAASKLLFPLNFSVTLVQWTFAFYVFTYIWFRAEKNFGKLKYLLLIVLAFPGILFVAANGHRIYPYALLTILFFATIAFDIVEQRKRKPSEMLVLTVAAAFLSVWRSEGIILGALGLGVYLLYTYGRKILRTAGFVAVFLCFFVLFSLPQKIGSIKYYGSDYSIYNSFVTLEHILNDPDANLSYDGAADDLKAIDAVVPIRYIKRYAVDGFRRYNYSVKGNKDINQTGCTAEEGKAFETAYTGLILHNPRIYIKTQVAKLLGSVGIYDAVRFEVSTDPEPSSELAEWEYCGWTEGYSDFFSEKAAVLWRDLGLRGRIGRKVYRTRNDYLEFLMDHRLYAGFAAALILAGIFTFFRSFFDKKKYRTWLGLLCGVVLLNFCAVAAVMPDGHLIYLTTTIYPLLLILMTFWCKRKECD
ncbi:MAG: hypothetical protein K6E32_07380 [Lachnospiraceae bacterium]|nr:hypothetical protein [Lachnospiraceae bacterium]